jgi:hypothetical protein
MPASKTVALDFVDSAFKPKPLFGASRLSLLKGSYLAPKALLQLQPGASPQRFDYAITSAESALQSARRIKRVSEMNRAFSAAGFFISRIPGRCPKARE